MNERIEELAKYCGYNGDYCTEDFSLEMFAELIIKEAIDVVNKRYMGDNNREDFEVRRCVEDLKKHFGVES